MDSNFRRKLLDKLEQLDSKSAFSNENPSKLLNKLYNDLIIILSEHLQKKTNKVIKKIILGHLKQEYHLKFGIHRKENEIIFAKWLLKLQPKTRSILLSFLLIKESLLHFFDIELREEDEMVFSIITLLLILEATEIVTIIDSPIASITGKIYQDEVAGISFYYWYNLLFLLNNNNVSFLDVLNQYEEIIGKKQLSQRGKIAAYAQWVFSKTIKEENTILPIFTNLKLINLIELILELGHEKANTTFIAKKLGKSRKTITKWFKALNENFSTYWRPDINYEEMNLHNYFVKINTKNNTIKTSLSKTLQKIPYIKTLYHGFIEDEKILYSPSLIGPHIVSEQLNEDLRKLEKNGKIIDYTVQLVREKYRYFTISNFPFRPKLSIFNKLLNEGDSHLRKYLFSHEKRSSFLPQADKDITLDYSLLYFLSILKSKFLLKARYGVRMNEFKDFYSEKGIDLTNVDAQQALLYQNELRAKRKGLLSFSLWMMNFFRSSSNIMIFEIPTSSTTEKEIGKIVNQIRIFSYLGQVNLYDRFIFTIPGIAHTHPVRDIIENVLRKQGIEETNFYTIQSTLSRYVPLQELYNYDAQKWKIANF